MNETDIQEEDMRRAFLMIGMGLIGIGASVIIPNGWWAFLLGFYSCYRGLVELTFYKKGINMPNAWKIVVAILLIIGFNVAVSTYSSSLFWQGFATNFAENLNAIIDGAIRLYEYFATNSTVAIIPT